MTTPSRYSPHSTAEPAPAPLELLEVCWRARGTRGRLLCCGLYRTAAGLELRTGHEEYLLYSERIASLPAGRARALELKAALETGNRQEHIG